MSLQKFDTLDGYVELRKWLDSLRGQSVSQWTDAMRWYAQHDLFFLLNDILSDGKQIHDLTNQPMFFHQFYVDWCRQVEWQVENGGGVDASSRRSGKSTIRTKASNIQRMLLHPNSAGCLFSYQRKAARKHIFKIKTELEQNKLLHFLFPDVLFEDPLTAARNGETIWSMEAGLNVKRTINRGELSMEFNAFMDGTPTGGGYDRLDFDDVEDHKALGNEEQLAKLKHAYDSSVNLLTPTVFKRPVSMMQNTFYSDIGLVQRVFNYWRDKDERHTRKMPGEDLGKPGDGPMGGTPMYPFHVQRLHDIYDQMEMKSEYGVQICCDFLVGESRVLRPEWLLRYSEPPERIGKGRNIYICIDPSSGKGDPMAIWVWGLGADKKAVWLDASLKRLDPALPEFYNEIFLLVAKWNRIGRVVEIRVEQFGQSTFAEMIAKDLAERNYYIPVVPCADNMRSGKFQSGKRDREYERWAKPAATGEVMIPRPVSERTAELPAMGLVRPDEKGNNRCLVDYFLKSEYGMFPKCTTDNMLDAGSLLWEPEERVGRVLQYPAPSYRKRAARQGGGRSSWMSMG